MRIDIDIKFFNELEEQIKKDFGEKCRVFSPLCPTCQAWLAYATLRDLYEVDYSSGEWKK